MTAKIDRSRFDVIDLAELSRALVVEMGPAEGYSAFFAAERAANGSPTGNGVQIAWNDREKRAGLISVGPDASGYLAWTDADSLEDALRRYLDDDLIE